MGAVGLKQLNAAAWLTTSRPLLCPEYWVLPQLLTVILTHSLFIFTSAPTFSLPGFNMPSFILHFSEDSIYLLYIFHWHFFQPFSLFLSAHPLCCPSPSKAIILFPFSLYLHDTKGLSEAGVDGKRQVFTKRFRFNIFPLLFITIQELHSRTNSPLVITLSFCKYHGPSLIFILLPPLSLRTPTVD